MQPIVTPAENPTNAQKPGRPDPAPQVPNRDAG